MPGSRPCQTWWVFSCSRCRCSVPSSSNRHRSTACAPADHSAKLVPVPSQWAPRGAGRPGHTSYSSGLLRTSAILSAPTGSGPQRRGTGCGLVGWGRVERSGRRDRSEEHTSELQSRQYLVCRLLLEKKNQGTKIPVGRLPWLPADTLGERLPTAGEDPTATMLDG